MRRKNHHTHPGPYPDCVIVGAMKCGTGALRDFLMVHPHLVMARKEVHFFDKNLDKVCVVQKRNLQSGTREKGEMRRPCWQGWRWYLNTLESKTEKQRAKKENGSLLLEKTPRYFTSKWAPALLRKVSVFLSP